VPIATYGCFECHLLMNCLGINVVDQKKHGKDQAKLLEMNIIAKRLEGKDETTDSAEIEIEEIKLGQLYTAEELSRIKKVMNSHAGKKRRYDELGNGSDGN
jgi:threonine aldolase